MNRLQAKEHELLRNFIQICERLGLSYYLVCGSALGAVKYGGFIPWDDDIDVGLPREDYEVFIAKAQPMLPKHIFLQNYHTDRHYPQIYSKLRDSNTTYIETSASKLDIHHGIYIDIFPLDGYPKSKCAQMRLELRKSVYHRLMAAAYLPDRWWKSALYLPLRLLGFHRRTAKTAAKYERLVSQYSTADSLIWCNHGNGRGRREYAERSQYGDGKEAVFEGLTVKIPEQINAYLTQKYGDWRAELPECQKVGHHYYTMLDTEKPYTEYIGFKGKRR